MPAGDGSGPEGRGPRSGRGLGYCSGFNMPGYANAMPGRGMGYGGGRGWGRGVGYGRGWGRGRAALGPMPGWGAPAPYVYPQPTAADESAYLKEQAQALKDQLDVIQKRLDDLDET